MSAERAKVPPTQTSSQGGPKPLNSSWLSGSDIQSSGTAQAIACSTPGIRQPTGTSLSAAWASMSQTQITPALGQGSSYGQSRGQPVSGGSLSVPIEAMSFRVPLSQPYNLYSSLPQTSMQSSQDVPISRPVHLTTPAPALLSQDQGSTLVPIFQQCAQAKWQHVPASTAWQPTEDGDLIFMGITHEDNDDIQDVSVVDKSPMVPEKHQQVVQKVTQNVTQNVAQSTSKVSEAATYNAAELVLIQSFLGKPVTLMDAEDSPIKVAKWKKKHIAKEWDQSWD